MGKGDSFHNNLIPIAHYPYVNITLPTGRDNKTPYSLTQNPVDGRPDYFISLDHTRYTNQANTITINVTYVPTGKANPNDLECAIRNSRGLFRFQYGTSKNTNLSPVYVGMMYDYTVSIAEGQLNYTISAVSRSVLANYNNLKDAKLGINCNENGKTDSVDDVLDKMEQVIKNSDLKDYCVFDKKHSARAFKVTKTVPCSDKTPMNYLMEIAGTLVDTEDSLNHFYKIVVSDIDDPSIGGKSRIRLIRTGTAEVGKYVFQWGGRNTDILSWKPSFQGAYTIFKNNWDEDYPQKNLINTFTPDKDGNYAGAQIQTFDTKKLQTSLTSELSSTASISLSESATLASTEIQDFEEKVLYPYKASLTVLGIGGDELIIGYSIIQVCPYINGIAHHSAGKYVITGITDSVNQSGFTTSLDLYRYIKLESASNTDTQGYEGLRNPQTEHTTGGGRLTK